MVSKQKVATDRICVTLPQVLLDHYRQLSRETGLSVSKIILITLRKKNDSVILLPVTYVKFVDRFNNLISSALVANTVTPELKQQIATLEYLARRADILVDKKGANYYAKT